MIEALRAWWRRPLEVRGPVDPVLAAVAVTLIGLGVVMVYSASAVGATMRYGDPEFFLRRQTVYALLALGAMVVGSRVEFAWLRRWTYPLLLLTFGLLAASVLGLGHTGGGAARWLALGPIHVQPSEIAKLALILQLSLSLARKSDGRMQSFMVGLLPHLVVLGVLALLCLKQPDFGSALVLSVLTIMMTFLAGARALQVGGVIAFGLVAGAWAIFGTSYRWERIQAWADLVEHRRDLAYQPYQAVMTFGAGEATGAGLGGGHQALFLPEAHTDFISAIVGEELGFLGILALCAAYFTIMVRGIRVSLGARDPFATYVAFGVSALFGLQALVNLMVAMALLPTKGLTLPFVSYGGSSLIVCGASMGLLLSVSRGQHAPALVPAAGAAPSAAEPSEAAPAFAADLPRMPRGEAL